MAFPAVLSGRSIPDESSGSDPLTSSQRGISVNPSLPAYAPCVEGSASFFSISGGGEQAMPLGLNPGSLAAPS